MREIHNDLIKQHTALRFRSEYDYALFEYYRSAKVIAFLDRIGVRIDGRIMDCGCGGGGMPLSLAEHAQFVVGIDPLNRFGDAGVKLAKDRGITNLKFMLADGMALPFGAGEFDLVLSHAVIEHVPDAQRYLSECRRVTKPGGRMYMSTAPYLSFAGAHLPKLLIPIPLHWIFGRWVAFRTFRWLAKHAPWTLREPIHENTFIRDAQRGVVKHDDLLEKVRMKRMQRLVHDAGWSIVVEQRHVSGTVRRLPAGLARWIRDSRLTEDLVLSNVEWILEPRP